MAYAVIEACRWSFRFISTIGIPIFSRYHHYIGTAPNCSPYGNHPKGANNQVMDYPGSDGLWQVVSLWFCFRMIYMKRAREILST